MTSISYAFRIAHNTVSKIVSETCDVIWNSLKIKFNNCIEAPDGKHVVIQTPPNSGSTYYNYKRQYSLILLGISDANCCFTVVDIGDEGRQCDSAIFQNSEMVADEAFPLTTFMMKPYPRNNLNTRRKVFNYRLSRARRSIECAFGILAARWRIYGKPIIASVPTARKIIQATTALHNYDRAVISEGLKDLPRNNSLNPVEAKKIREDFTNFFNGIGALPWQWDK
ncbi:nuclease harbi1-like protein, partial [Lasius niger]